MNDRKAAVGDSGDTSAFNVSKEERLRRQKERQEEFRINLDLTNKAGSSREDLTKIKEERDFVSWNDIGTNSFRKPFSVDEIDDSEIMLDTSTRSKFSGQNVIIVDSREINSGQDIISDLRFKHNFHVSVAQLEGCDYVLSNRMAVERKQWSDFGNGANRAKLVQRLQELSELYDRPCVVVEKDKVKGRDEKMVKTLNWTKYIDRTIAQLIKSQIQLVFTENSAETAQVLGDLCKLEQRKNMGITVSVNLNQEQKCKVKFYLTLPKLSYIHALNLCHSFQTVSGFMKASISAIEKQGKMSKNRATDIFNYIHREFDENMLPSRYK